MSTQRNMKNFTLLSTLLSQCLLPLSCMNGYWQIKNSSIKLITVLLVDTEKYEEDIEQLLIERVEDTEQEICYKLSRACEGVDRSVKAKEPFEYSFNNMRQKVKTESPPPPQEDDGIQRMNVDINDPGAAERLAEQIKSQLGQQAMGGGEDGDEDDEEEEEEEEEEGAGEEVTGEEDDTQSFKEKTEL